MGRRPNAKHDLNRSKSPLTLGGIKVGGAPARREQSPEPKQITSEGWRLLAEKGPPKGDTGATKRQTHEPKMGLVSRQRTDFAKTARSYEHN
jgi:hypothetical protein